MTEPSTSPRRRPRALRVALAAGVVALLAVAAPQLDAWQRRRFADRMARLAEASPAGAAQLAVRRLADAGPEALDPLVRVAGSGNVDAALAAQRAVSNQLSAWELARQSAPDDDAYTRRLLALAAALAAHEPAAAPHQRLWMRRTALRLVDACQGIAPEQALAILADCDRVLTSSRPAAPLAARPAPTPPAAASTVVEAPGGPAAEEAPPPAPPVVRAPEAELLVVEPSQPATTRAEAESRQLPWHAPAEAAPAAPAAPEVASDAPRVRPLPAPSPSASVVDVPSPLEARRLLRRYRQMSDRQLAAELAKAADYEALAIQQVLRERRLPSVAAPRSANPSAAGGDAERRLFDRVSRLPAADARRLLRELADDANESPEMRLEALTLLATTGDPRLAEIARRRAAEDHDPRVAELASRILREQRSR